MGKLIRHPGTILALVLGVIGVAFVLFAWQLPPFSTSVERTDNAYARSKITFVAPQVQGHVAEVLVTDYQEVKAGDLLARIDDRIYVQQVAQAKAQLAQQQAALASAAQQRASATAQEGAAEAALNAARVNSDVAQREFDRFQTLVQRGVTSQADLDTARAKRDQAAADVNSAEAQVEIAKQDILAAETARGSTEAAIEAAKAALQLAQIDLDNTRILAPEDGRLGEIGTRVGQYVTAGTQMMGLVPHRVWVVANFKETQVADMKIGQPAEIYVDAWKGRKLTGWIESVSPATGNEFSVLKTDNATGNFTKVTQRLPVRIALDDEASGLVPGLSVEVRVDTSSEPVDHQKVQ
ncbi:HlyD family secretion protein [Falsirhodobacter algicola]|uniref:HlyD family efflux transporter periplasmic adaptor subunit n=1 Tax=Falsirhodobacter algicola TaxID=2692330 RepID=A0A8J8SK14_9RHOB|nr:HlyD family secretion protein [Falsirhodobacter algicola]QUS35036.1 HlyD family efflux transporter periplasmic adaptor subunit [Falsirhodobacter algicola]